MYGRLATVAPQIDIVAHQLVYAPQSVNFKSSDPISVFFLLFLSFFFFSSFLLFFYFHSSIFLDSFLTLFLLLVGLFSPSFLGILLLFHFIRYFFFCFASLLVLLFTLTSFCPSLGALVAKNSTRT